MTKLVRTPGTLLRHRSEGTFDDIAKALAGPWTGWTLGVRNFELVRCAGGSLLTATGPLDTNDVYEAVLFDGTSELRWRRNGPSGVAVEVREADDGYVAVEGDLAYDAKIDSIAGLLWGQGDGVGIDEGWSSMSTARLGSYPAPITPVPKKARVELLQSEYVTRGAYGVARVVDRRFIRLQVLQKGAF